MNKLVKLIILAPMLFTSQISNATLPNGKLTGIMEIQKGIHSYCDIEIDINGNLADVIFHYNYGCVYVAPSGSPYNITYNDNTVTFHSVYLITAGAGDCYGDLTAEWDGAYLIFEDVLPSTIPGGQPCYVLGVVE